MEQSAAPVTKAERREKIKNRRRLRELKENGVDVSGGVTPEIRRVHALTEAQGHYMVSIESSDLTFGLGPAGTGKTYICAALAAIALRERRISKLILTRPAVEVGEKLGFLPGNLDEKYEPYLRPFRDIFDEFLGKSFVDNLIRNGKIEAIPLAYMRGMTFNNCWVILDEAQNTTPVQMKMFLTRIGMHSKVVVNGDISQTDIRGETGLADAIDRLEGIDGIGTCEFTEEDVVRSGLVRTILKAYR